MIGSGDEDHIHYEGVCQGRTQCRTLKTMTPLKTIMLSIVILTHQVMWMTSLRSPWPLHWWHRKTGVPGTLVRYRGAQHQRMAASHGCPSLRGLRTCPVEQVEEVAVRVASETVSHVRGYGRNHRSSSTRGEVALILACGVCKYQEYQALKGKREDKDIISYRQLQKKFGTNKRTLMEVIQGYKYRYPGGVSTKVPFVMTKPEEEEEETPTTSSTPTASKVATTSDPTTT